MLEPHTDIVVAGEAHTGSEAVEMLVRDEPDVVLLDYRLPDLDGVSVMNEIHERGCGTRVVMLTCHTDPHCVRAAIHGGAVGFLTKGSVDVTSLVNAIRSARKGKSSVSPDALVSLMSVVRHDDVACPDHLTPRETEMWRMVSLGMSNDEIATELCLSVCTVKYHVGNLFRKIGVRSRAQAAAMAYRDGYMDQEN